MRTKSYKEETFTSWYELITLIEYLALTDTEFEPILKLLKERYNRQMVFQDILVSISVKEFEIFDTDNTYAGVIHKWLETIVNAYKFLQYAKSRGGIYGHKVGQYGFLKRKF